MKPFATSLPAFPVRGIRLAFAGAAAALLLACGGGFDLAGGVGSGGSGMAEGRVSGFGSVLVDGIEYDDTGAAVQVQGADGSAIAATVRIGQRVRVAMDAQGKATAIEVLPQLLGPVTAGEDAGWLQVAGQWVKVTDTTVRAGSASAASVAAGEEVEVHGAWVPDADKGFVLDASRIEPRSGPANAPVLVSGIVQSLRAEGGRTVAVLNRAGGTALRSTQVPADVAPGRLVSAWIERTSLAASTLDTAALRSGEPAGSEGQVLVLGGPARSVGNGRITVQGVTAVLSVNTPADAVRAGSFVQLNLRRGAAGWEVTSLRTRGRPEDLGGRVALKGMARGIDWTARPLVLSIRQTPVEIPPDVLAASNCATTAGTAQQVDITALPGRQPLAAVALKCSAAAGNANASSVDQASAAGSSPRTQ